jgi:DNA ligase D-like protein (predicted 3'-phosphoesterase)
LPFPWPRINVIALLTMATRKKTTARKKGAVRSSTSAKTTRRKSAKKSSRAPTRKSPRKGASNTAHKSASKTARKSASKTVSKTTRKTAHKSAPRSKAETARKSARASSADQLKEYQRKRDFEKTAEPSGASTRKRTSSRGRATKELRFVIQKHDASHLHYDLRLEMDGVMKSWAVPKGPSADPSVKRLAMQVEDHPIEYNTFEGTIPAGEYGGGTVMLWDNGTYEIENAITDDQNAAAHDEYERGELKLDFHGKRIKGSYALVRTRGMGGSSSKPSWLLIKHRDNHAAPETDSSLTEKYMKSVTTNRTMDEISEGTRVWHSSR